MNDERRRCDMPIQRDNVWRIMAACLVIVFHLTSIAFAVDATDLARRQVDQQRARQMAKELVSTVLDLQIRQLEENGLVGLPIYEDIRLMRGNLSTLVDREMAAVVERLIQAQNLSGSEREAKFVEARRAIRKVVIRLSVERQALLRRLKAAEMAEQVRRIIELQFAMFDATAQLGSLPPDRRPDAILRTIEDQRDIQQLYLGMVASLDEVKTWDGPIATAASDGLRLLKNESVESEFGEVIISLDAANYEQANQEQASILEVLKKLLAMLETSERVDSAANALSEQIRQLRESQQALKERVEQEGLSVPPKPEMVEAQQKIAKELSELAGRLPSDPTSEALRQQAEAAAKAATESLFNANEQQTLDEQQRAIDRLASLEESLQNSNTERRDRSAADLAETARTLEAVRDELKQAAANHEKAVSVSEANPKEAAAAEASAAEQAASIAEREELPPEVSSQIADAAEASQRASESLKEGDATESTNDALAETSDAFQRANAAIEEAIADAKRAEAAVRIGELARAAEALERAAAAERELGAQAAAAAEKEGLSAEQAAAMEQIQKDISDVASKAAEGVKAASPEAAEMLQTATKSSEQASSALAKARQDPGEASKPAAGEAAKQANQTADQLTSSAAELRRQVGETAKELAQLSQEQQSPIAAAQQAVEQAAEAIQNEPGRGAEAAKQAADAASQAETGATSAAQAARRAAESGAKQDASDALDRAAIGLAARQQQLQQEGRVAEQLAQLAQRQQAAVESIAQARQSLAAAPPDPAEMSPPQKDAARALHNATRQFSAAQRATGQGAAQVSKQQQIANAPIREALQAAERLPIPQLPGEPAAEPTEVADAGQAGEAGEGQPSAQEGPGQSGESPSQSPASDAAQGASSGAKSNENVAGASQSAGSQATGLGTGLVPAAPDETASMMAGPEAQAAMAALEAAGGIESSEDVAASETGAPLDGAGEGTPAGQGEEGQQTAANKGNTSAEGSPASGDAQTPNATGRDTDAAGGATDAGWFAKLPPEVRAGIRASSSQPAPRGYEGRLKRYFESVE